MCERMRVGLGYDIHPFEEGRKLILGGVEIPFNMGLKGVSDADVVIHAIIDALFGACGLPDIGEHFPPDDPRYAGISSIILLKRALEEVRNNGFEIINVDITVILDKPRLTPYKESIKRRVAELLGISHNNVGFKAKSREGLNSGKEGIEAFAVVLLKGV